LDIVALAFQVSAHLFEDHAVAPSSQPRHVFSDDPCGLDMTYDCQHVWPLVAVIRRAVFVSGPNHVSTGLIGRGATHGRRWLAHFEFGGTPPGASTGRCEEERSDEQSGTDRWRERRKIKGAQAESIGRWIAWFVLY
jgi:hypothetical protein